MEALNLPTYFFRIKEVNSKKYIFDEIRRRFVVLTPEEWVRQHMIKFLIVDRHFPLTLFSIEKKHVHNRMVRRCDFIVYDRQGNPLLVAECKAPSIEIGQQVFDQASRYNQQFNAPYLLITNGNKHFCCKVNTENHGFEFLHDIPSYDLLTG
ncbi:MAG: type I restriction enzyme HsdR N-terminal domain-containing protein [Bacteroidales bacterium]|nr:type I restriction enzyme HsdR N-terminal domain-containing protein [Bacteroidales bacterium]